MRLLRLSLVPLMSLTACSPAASVDDAGPPIADGAVDAAVVDAAVVDTAIPLDASRDTGAPPELGYLEDIHPIFEAAGCATFACHGATQAGAGIIVLMSSARVAYDDMLERPSVLGDGVVVHAGAPDESRLVLHAETTHVPMGILTAEQAALVRRWVAVGAAYSRTGSTDPGEVPSPSAPTTCDLSAWRGWDWLPGACLPRCTRATWDAVVACRTAADVTGCQSAAIMADTTAAIQPTGGTDAFDVDCNTCLEWQTRGCIEDVCGRELLALDRCTIVRTGDPCTAERSALGACQSAHPEIVTCQRSHDPLCVAP